MTESKTGNLKEGNAHDQAKQEGAPSTGGAAAPAPGGGDHPHGDTMAGGTAGATTAKTTPGEQPAAAAAAGEGQAQAPTTDAGKQGHQGVLTQNNQQAVAGGTAESRVGAVDPLQMRNLTTPMPGTRPVTVKSPNFHFNGQGPFKEGETLHVNEDEHRRMAAHVNERP